jgi:hypothetical protein
MTIMIGEVLHLASQMIGGEETDANLPPVTRFMMIDGVLPSRKASASKLPQKGPQDSVTLHLGILTMMVVVLMNITDLIETRGMTLDIHRLGDHLLISTVTVMKRICTAMMAAIADHNARRLVMRANYEIQRRQTGRKGFGIQGKECREEKERSRVRGIGIGAEKEMEPGPVKFTD